MAIFMVLLQTKKTKNFWEELDEYFNTFHLKNKLIIDLIEDICKIKDKHSRNLRLSWLPNINSISLERNYKEFACISKENKISYYSMGIGATNIDCLAYRTYSHSNFKDYNYSKWIINEEKILKLLK